MNAVPASRSRPRGARLAMLFLAMLLSVIGAAGVASGTTPAGSTPSSGSADKSAKASDIGVQDICNYTTSRPTISRGATGNAVKQAQCYLYYSILGTRGLEPHDGEFGPLTDLWVRLFQHCAGISVDGNVGPQTWNNLSSWANSSGWVCGVDRDVS